jgi:hypothetical protein
MTIGELKAKIFELTEVPVAEQTQVAQPEVIVAIEAPATGVGLSSDIIPIGIVGGMFILIALITTAVKLAKR